MPKISSWLQIKIIFWADITITDQYVVARFNAKGEILEFQPLHDSLPVTSAAAPVAYVDPISGKEFMAATFCSRYKDAAGITQSSVGLAVFDDLGNRVPMSN